MIPMYTLLGAGLPALDPGPDQQGNRQSVIESMPLELSTDKYDYGTYV